MDTPNKGAPVTTEATMGNQASSSSNISSNNNKKTSTPNTTASDKIKAESNNTDSTKQSNVRAQSNLKKDTKETAKSPSASDQIKTPVSETTSTASTASTTATTTTTTTTTTLSATSTNNDLNKSASTDKYSASGDDTASQLPTVAQTGDKSTGKQDSASKPQIPSSSEVTSSVSSMHDNAKALNSNSASSLQHIQRSNNKALHNSYHHNNSNHNQQQHNSNQYHSHYHQQHSRHQVADEQLSKTNLYIRGLNADTSDSDLYTLCNRFGSIVSTKAILDKSTNKCKGYGFVDFDNPVSAEMAVVELQKQGMLVHMAKQQEADPTNLYLANLPQTMTESDLENLLRPYGQVVSTRILINQNRQPRGVGFARMETKEQCDSIIALLNGQVIKGSKEPLLVKFADGANKKRPHHFQHKPLGGNLFMGDNHLRRNNGNDTNHYHMMSSGASSNRNFHGGSFSEHPRQSHTLTHHDNGIIKHQQMLTSMPGYHPHHQSGSHSYMMMGPTSGVDPSMHYVNIANQMQGLQIGNHPVSGYMSPQQWPPVWPQGGSSAFSNTSNTSRDAILR